MKFATDEQLLRSLDHLACLFELHNSQLPILAAHRMNQILADARTVLRQRGIRAHAPLRPPLTEPEKDILARSSL